MITKNALEKLNRYNTETGRGGKKKDVGNHPASLRSASPPDLGGELFDSYGFVLTDRSRSRIFTAKLGTITRHADIHAMRATRHVKTTGTDHLYSQSHLQRKADEHALAHFKAVVEVLDHLSKANPFDRLVLAGTHAATSKVFRLLPKSMRAKVVASITLASNADESQILEKILVVARKADEERLQTALGERS